MFNDCVKCETSLWDPTSLIFEVIIRKNKCTCGSIITCLLS